MKRIRQVIELPALDPLLKRTVTVNVTTGVGRGLTARSICGPIIATAWEPAAGVFLLVFVWRERSMSKGAKPRVYPNVNAAII